MIRGNKRSAIAWTLVAAAGAVFCLPAQCAPVSINEAQALFPDLSSQASGPYRNIIQAAVSYIGGDARLVEAVIHAESRGNPGAVSKSGAIGLMQLMPTMGAAESYQALYRRRGIPTTTALKDPAVNIWLGVQYMHVLWNEYLGDLPDEARQPIMLAAYNWGIGRVSRRKHSGLVTRAQALRWIEVNCPAETIAYVRAVLSRYDRAPGTTLASR